MVQIFFEIIPIRLFYLRVDQLNGWLWKSCVVTGTFKSSR